MPGEPSKGNEKCGMMFAFNGRYRKREATVMFIGVVFTLKYYILHLV